MINNFIKVYEYEDFIYGGADSVYEIMIPFDGVVFM